MAETSSMYYADTAFRFVIWFMCLWVVVVQNIRFRALPKSKKNLALRHRHNIIYISTVQCVLFFMLCIDAYGVYGIFPVGWLELIKDLSTSICYTNCLMVVMVLVDTIVVMKMKQAVSPKFYKAVMIFMATLALGVTIVNIYTWSVDRERPWVIAGMLFFIMDIGGLAITLTTFYKIVQFLNVRQAQSERGSRSSNSGTESAKKRSKTLSVIQLARRKVVRVAWLAGPILVMAGGYQLWYTLTVFDQDEDERFSDNYPKDDYSPLFLFSYLGQTLSFAAATYFAWLRPNSDGRSRRSMNAGSELSSGGSPKAGSTFLRTKTVPGGSPSIEERDGGVRRSLEMVTLGPSAIASNSKVPQPGPYENDQAQQKHVVEDMRPLEAAVAVNIDDDEEDLKPTRLSLLGAKLRTSSDPNESVEVVVNEPFDVSRCVQWVEDFVHESSDFDAQQGFDLREFITELRARWDAMDQDRNGEVTVQEIRRAVWQAEPANKGVGMPFEEDFPQALEDVVAEVRAGAGGVHLESYSFWGFCQHLLEDWEVKHKVPTPDKTQGWAWANPN